MKYIACFLVAFLLVVKTASAQAYDLLIKDAIVIDPKNGINKKMDLAIKEGRIAKLAETIAPADAKKIIDASGLYLVPGLIDIHTHVFVGAEPEKFANGQYSVSPDDFSFRSGVTTVVDAGTSGWKNFPIFKKQVIDHAKTRVLVFLNINALGICGKPAEEDISSMLVDSAVHTFKLYPDIIVGIKIGHFEGDDKTPFSRALEAATKTNTPLFVECHLPKYSLSDQLNKMRPGDIITHSFESIEERMPVVDEHGKLRSFVLQAQQKGILFDVGHGGAGFWFSQAIPAFQQGLVPNSFGTDLHQFSMNAGMKSIVNLMSKYMAIGMTLPDAVARASWRPAMAIHRPDLGNLSEGAVADICLLNLLQGEFGFTDAGGFRITGKEKLEAELTIRAGKIVWDLNGRSAKNYAQ
jgi:dihydroorotase